MMKDMKFPDIFVVIQPVDRFLMEVGDAVMLIFIVQPDVELVVIAIATVVRVDFIFLEIVVVMVPMDCFLTAWAIVQVAQPSDLTVSHAYMMISVFVVWIVMIAVFTM
jgi:hypothetical protein